MATNYSLTDLHPTRDPREEAFDAQREADRYRMAARLTPNITARRSLEEWAEHYQACADRHNARAKAGQ